MAYTNRDQNSGNTNQYRRNRIKNFIEDTSGVSAVKKLASYLPSVKTGSSEAKQTLNAKQYVKTGRRSGEGLPTTQWISTNGERGTIQPRPDRGRNRMRMYGGRSSK